MTVISKPKHIRVPSRNAPIEMLRRLGFNVRRRERHLRHQSFEAHRWSTVSRPAEAAALVSRISPVRVHLW